MIIPLYTTGDTGSFYRYTSCAISDIATAVTAFTTDAYSQERSRAEAKRMNLLVQDSIKQDTIATALSTQHSTLATDSIAAENKRKLMEMTTPPSIEVEPIPNDSMQKAINPVVWKPDPTKATWLALIIPGGGQIYNKKYWKLPIIYGGFAGCAYALTWNGNMYRDYSNAYKDAVNNRWDATSITDLIPAGYLNRVSKTQLTEMIRKRKDTYRRYRDLSIFAFIGVYLISVVDAYVDAELSNFDIGPDLSMRIEPTVINTSAPSLSKRNVGVQCSFCF